MSTATEDMPEMPAFDPQTEREEMIEMLHNLMESAYDRAENGNMYSNENERTRQQWFREVGYLAKVTCQIMKDRDLEEMDERLQKVEDARYK